MQLQIKDRNMVAVTNDEGEHLVFNWGRLSRLKEKQFALINALLALLSTLEKQTLFETFKKIYNIMISGRLERLPEVEVALKDMYQALPLSRFREQHDRLVEDRIPNDLSDQGGHFPEKTTYLREDYRALLFYSTLLKLAAPVMGAFVHAFKKEVGNNQKELRAKSLLRRTGLFEMEAYTKLKEYVEEVTAPKLSGLNQDMAEATAFHSLGSHILPEYLLSIILVRKVATFDVYDGVALFQNIHSNLMEITREGSLHGSLGQRTYERKYRTNTLEEDKSSRADMNKLREEQRASIALVCEEYLKRPDALIRTLCPDINLANYRELICPKRQRQMEGARFTGLYQQLMAGMLTRRHVGRRSFDLIPEPAWLSTVIATEVYLYHNGLDGLADHMVAEPVRDRGIAVAPLRALEPALKTRLQEGILLKKGFQRALDYINEIAALHAECVWARDGQELPLDPDIRSRVADFLITVKAL